MASVVDLINAAKKSARKDDQVIYETSAISDRLKSARESAQQEDKIRKRQTVLPTASQSRNSAGIELPGGSEQDGALSGLTLLPSSPQQAARDFAYASERIGAGLLGAAEGVSDFLGAGFGKAVQGITSFGGLAPNPVSEWGGRVAEHYLTTSPTQEYEENIRQRYNPTRGAETVTGVEQTIAQMLPGIGAARAVSAAGNALNAAQEAQRGANAGRALFGLQAAGQSAQQAKEEGATTNEALAYGAASGLLESAIEGIAGGIPALGSGRLNEAVSAVTRNPVLNRAADIAGEGAEEAISTAVTPYLQRSMYNPDAENATPREILQSAALGSLAAGVLQGGLELPGAVSRTVSDIRDVRQAVGSNQDIINRANQRISQDMQARREAVNPLLTMLPTAEEFQNRQAGSPVYQRAMRAELPVGGRQISDQTGRSGMSLDGDTIYRENENTEPTSDGRASLSGAFDTVVSSVSNNSILPLADIDPLPEGVTLESEVPPVVQRLSQALGRNIQMYDGSREGGTRGTANGYYFNGTIYVNSNTANPVAQVIAHELTHSVEMADAYQDLQNLIFERIQQTGGNLEQMRAQKADLYQRNGVNLNAQDLDAEIVAEYVEKNLLTDEASIQKLTRTNRTLAQRIRDWIDSILAKLGNSDAQSRVFLERARDAYSRALQQTHGTVDTVATVDTVGSVASQRQVQSLLDQYDSGAITQEQLIEQAARLLEGEADEQYSVSYDSSGNVNPKYSISEYTDQERQDHARTVLDHFGKTHSWNETGYITQDGSRVDLSGKHEGGPGGYRTVDHRDISDALGEDYGDGDYSGAMVQFISEGNIRISPESGGIDLSVQPTRAQERSLEDFISKNRGEVILDIDTPDGDTVASVEYPRGTSAQKVIADIRNYFSDGTTPQVSEVSRFRYSLDENQRNQFVSMLRNYARGNWNEQTIQEYLNLVRQNGEYDQGANAARPVLVPQRDSEGNPVSRTARTAMGAKAIPDDAIADIQNMVLRGELSYNRVSDKSSIDRAIKTIQDKGYQGALEEFRNSVSKGVVSKDIATLGQQLLINAANAGDGKTTAELLTLYAQMETTAGQAVQAASILRKLAPSDQLYAAQRTVSDLEKTIRKNYKDIEITIDQSLIEEFGNQTTQEGRDQVLDKIYQNVADQIPSTWKDKWNAWRYLAMLGNPRTHIRNIAGNVFFQPLRIVKDRTAAAIEAGVSLASGGRLQRTKSFAANPALYKAAWNDWDNVRNVLSGNKYDDIRSEINSRRRIFRAKPLELARTGNSWLLEFEDTIFKRITYADALAGYLQANGVTAEQMRTNTVDAGLMARARDYAGQEALRATYQDRNKVSDKVVQVANVLGPAGEAILPFKRTPANILVRGLEYSPAGLAKALTADLIQVKRGNMTGAEAIDHIASGLTGSALFALGAYLFSQGIVTSGGGDDENQDRLNELTGGQNYALNLPGGGNVTLDWMAPEALPFFMGVELMDSMGQSGNTTDSIMTALKSVSDPMLELSMLQSLNDVIDSVSFSENKLGALASSAVVSYFTQAIPTLGGQFERTGEENRMSTYTDKALTIDLPGGLPEVGVPTDVQYAIGRSSARIPGWDYQQIPYIDAWGREESNGPLVLRAGNNFLNPAYTSILNVTPVDEEIQRLYTQTGDGGVVPDRPNRYITVNGERVDLSADQYVQYATERGQMQYDMLNRLIDRSAYQRLTDSEKAAVISDVYQYADAVTKAEISDYKPDSWIAKAQSNGVDPSSYILYRTSLENGMTLQDKSEAMTSAGIAGNSKTRLLIAENPDWADDAKEAGVTQNVFVEYKILTSGLTGDKDAEGNTISGSKKAKVLSAINSMDIDSETKDALYYAAGYAASGIQDTPWH